MHSPEVPIRPVSTRRLQEFLERLEACRLRCTTAEDGEVASAAAAPMEAPEPIAMLEERRQTRDETTRPSLPPTLSLAPAPPHQSRDADRSPPGAIPFLPTRLAEVVQLPTARVVPAPRREAAGRFFAGLPWDGAAAVPARPTPATPAVESTIASWAASVPWSGKARRSTTRLPQRSTSAAAEFFSCLPWSGGTP